MRISSTLSLARLPVAALAAGALALGLLAGPAGSAEVTMTDGTVYQGTVEPIGGGNYVKIALEGGGVKMTAASNIATVDGQPYGTPAAGVPADAGGGQLNEVPGEPRTGFGEDYKRISERTERIDEPVKGVDMWERFLSRKDISPAEREAAEQELAKWKTLYQDGAERIRGTWVGGDELKDLKKEVNEIIDDAEEKERGNNVIDAMRGYRQALAKYPNAFRPHYRMGLIAFRQGAGQAGRVDTGKLNQAKRHAMQALRLEPRRPAVLSSMGAVLFALRDYEKGVELMWKAAKISESELIVSNLLSALDSIPPRWMQANRTLRNIALEAAPLREKYQSGGLVWIEDHNYGLENADGEDVDSGPPGLQGKGSGFFVTADGYLLTNRHVAETDDGQYYRVRLADKDDDGNMVEYPARFVAADDEHDVALLKVELPEGVTVPFLKLSPDDAPPLASQVVVLGYPTTGGFDLVNQIMQVDTGTVKSINPDTEHEVWFDLSTTSGNSGGPIVDKHGNVVALLTAGLNVQNVWYVLGVSTRQVREFLADATDEIRIDDLPSASNDADGFNGELVTAEARPATLLVLIFNGEADEIATDDGDGDDEEPEDEEPADDGDEQGVGGRAGGPALK